MKRNCKKSFELPAYSNRAPVATARFYQDELYTYPYVLVCFFHDRGCGYSDGTVDACVDNFYGSASVYFNDYESEEDLVTESMVC